MTVMVTEGNDLIGFRIIRKLQERGEDVMSIDLAPPRTDLPLHRHQGDITRIPHLLEAVNLQ
ncbi:MAG: hypothetical protein OXN21_06665 [Chloroflexota bacterium]|nr:hypothetical protein [Chloroflexota bacterium]